MSDSNDEVFFNLVDEPWIPVLDRRGTERVLSLQDVFEQAEDLAELVGDLPTQAFAHLRVLLAVLHRAVEGPASVEEWTALRDDVPGTLDAGVGYLRTWHDRFWLRHPVHPFMQVADLGTAKSEVFGLSRVICDGPGGELLTTRSGARREASDWADAARWLIHAQAYDVSGIHSGAVGDPRVEGGKGYGIGTGWAGQLGGVHLVGGTLAETLLLNLVAGPTVGLRGGSGDLPVWEREPLVAAPEGWSPVDGPDQAYRIPTGPVDAYTWPARRIRLFGDGSACTGVVNAQGDRAQLHNGQLVEPMTAWTYSEFYSKVGGQDTYRPLTHDPSRSLWRGLASLLPSAPSVSVRADGPPRRRPPGVIRWFAHLQVEGAVDEGFVEVRTVGMAYGVQDSKFSDLVADRITLPSALLGAGGAALVERALEAVADADATVRIVGDFAQDVAAASGAGPEAGARDRAHERTYSLLDGAFRAWIRLLDTTSDLDQLRDAWQVTVRSTAERVGAEVVHGAGTAALVGRMVLGRHLDVGVAERRLWRRLRERLPHAFEDTERHQEVG